MYLSSDLGYRQLRVFTDLFFFGGGGWGLQIFTYRIENSTILEKLLDNCYIFFTNNLKNYDPHPQKKNSRSVWNREDWGNFIFL